MADPYAGQGDTVRLAADNGAASAAAATVSLNASGLACYACKRRKVKCDRQLPVCALCRKANAVCEYPTHAEKPGPKTGSLQGIKRRRLDHYASTSTSGIDSLLNAAGVGHAAAAALPRRNSVASLPSPNWPRQDAVHPQGEIHVATSEGGASGSSPASVRPPTTSQPTSAPIFSQIMYPSHEAQTRPQTPSTVDTPPANQTAARVTPLSVCVALKIPKETYDMLMEAYFANMTAFSLFRPNSIEAKFAMMQHVSEAEALVAAMFSFSARHCRDDSSSCPSPTHFAQVALSRLDESVDRYGDLRPPFWLLQAAVLVTYYQLTQSVRSRSWKRLGDCIRSAYEMHLHLVDANHDPTEKIEKSPADIQRWVLEEERRRAWWAIWEMDVFASTIRRLPTAINASVNLTLLPVADSCWFHDVYQGSSFLTEDCSLRWKHLSESGNQSAKAWYIVVNSLMRNTQRIVYPAGSAMRILNDRYSETHQDQLNIVANSLYCTTASLPSHLAYQGETLDFRPRVSQNHLSPRQEDADKYTIHLTTQLCRYMIYHHKICAQAPWLQSRKKDSPTIKERSATPQPPTATTSEWSNYMSASDEIVTIVRNSARDHYKYVNPFVANTLWFAAAAQCACKVFGPTSFNKRVVTSNLDLLKLTIDHYISFWGGMESLKGRLARIEAGLQNLMTTGGQPGGEADGHGDGQMPRGNGDDGMGRSGMQVPIDPGILPPGATTPAQPLVGMSGMGMNGWGDHRWSSFQDYGDFTQQFPMAGQGFYPGDPLDFSPFGMEELLVMNMDSNLAPG